MQESAISSGETLDSICQGAVQLIQRRSGYRFSIDAVLLGDFARDERGRVVDLGTGCGIIPLLLRARGEAEQIVGLELQEKLYQLALRNVELNQAGDRVKVLRGDIRAVQDLLPRESFDLALSNPPYRASGTGRVSPALERALARHELSCRISDIAEAAAYLVRDQGRLMVVYPSSRLGTLVEEGMAAGFRPRRMRFVHTRPDLPAKLVLFEAIKGGAAGLEVLPPLFILDETGRYSDEAARILGEPRP